MSYYRLVLLTSFIADIGVLRRFRCWWMLGVFLITLGDVASVDVDIVGVGMLWRVRRWTLGVF